MGGQDRRHRTRGMPARKELGPRVRSPGSRYAAIFRHESAQASQTATHASMPPIRLQSFAHSAQIQRIPCMCL
jgi:hypothetical protein